LVVLGAGMLARITNRTAMPSRKPANGPVELRAIEDQAVTETVDLRNGNLSDVHENE
jgi:hypothetical protein